MPEVNDLTTIQNGRVTGDQIVALWNKHEPTWQVRNKRIQAVYDLINDVTTFELPKEFDAPGKEQLIVSLPQKKLMPLRMANVLGRKRPRLKRFSVGDSDPAITRASSIETGMNAVMDQTADWEGLIGRLFFDGECGIVTLPAPAHWERQPDFMEEVDDPKAKGKKVTRPRESYWRDANDRPSEHPEYGRRSGARTKAAYQKELTDYLANHLPVVNRVINAVDCIPFLSPSPDGRGPKTDGMIVRTLYTREQLFQRRFAWSGSDLEPSLVPGAAGATVGSELYLYELYYTDPDGCPYVAYTVALHANGTSRPVGTTWNDGQDAVIDLYKEFDITAMPASYQWGWHWPTDDYPRRGVPFLDPIRRAISNAEALATSIQIHSYNIAFGGFGYEANDKLPAEAYLDAGGAPRNFKYEPMKAIMLPGKVAPLFHPGVGGDVKDLLRLILAAIDDSSPDDAAFGGGGDESGHAKSLAREYLETAEAQVLGGGLNAWEVMGANTAQATSKMARKADRDIEVYSNVKNTQVEAGGRVVTVRDLVKLKPDWFGRVYEMHAFFPAKAGDNIAQSQIMGQRYKDGTVTWEEMREALDGDEAPELTFARIQAHRELLTPEGMQEVRALVAQMQGDTEKLSRLRLKAKGEITANGTPTAMMEGLEPAIPVEDTPGTRMPYLPGAAVGGITAGAIGSSARLNDARAQAEAGGMGGTTP